MSTQLTAEARPDSNLALLNRVFKEQRIVLLRYFIHDTRAQHAPQSLSAELWHLLNNCVVIPAANVGSLELNSNTHTTSSLHDIINRIIATTVRQGIKPRQRPIFTRGFYLGTSSTHIDSMIPNTTVNFIKTRPWEELLMLIGESHMMTLLTHTLLLYQLPNNCYLQLTGLPVSVAHYDPARTLAHRHVTPALRRALGLPSRRRVRQVPVEAPARAPHPAPESGAQGTPGAPGPAKRTAKARRHVRHKRNKTRVAESVAASGATHVKERPAPSVTPAAFKARDAPRKRLGTRFVLPARTTPRVEVPAPAPVRVPDPEPAPKPAPIPAPLPPAPRKSPSPGAARSVKRAWVSLDHHAILYSNIHTRCRGLPLSHVLNTVAADHAGATQLARNMFNVPAQRNLPSRVTALLPLLTELIGAHKRCNYSALLEHHCPILPRTPTTNPVNPRKRARAEEENEPRESKRARVSGPPSSLLPPTPRQIKVQARLLQSPSPYAESFDLTQRTGTASTPQLSPRPSVPNFNLRRVLHSPGKSPRHASPVKLSPVKHASQDSEATPHKLYVTQDFTPSLPHTPLKTPRAVPLITQSSVPLITQSSVPLITQSSVPLITQSSDVLNSTSVHGHATAPSIHIPVHVPSIDHVPNNDHVEEQHSAAPTNRGPVAEQPDPTAKPRVKLSQMELSELLTYYSPDYQITAYLISVLQHVVPTAVWGSNHNARTVFNFVRRFVALRRKETLNSRELLTGFKLNDCAWLRTASTAHQPPSDHATRRDLLHQLLTWFMNELVVCLLRTNFYCTETAPHKHRIFYYRRPVWSRIHKLQMHHLLRQKMLRPLAPDEANKTLQGRKFGCAIIRFLPKTDGLRPILNLGRRPSTGTPLTHSGEVKRGPSINDALRNVFHVLTHEKNTSSAAKFGASVFSHDDEYRKLVLFKRRLQARHEGVLPQLYVVSVDISRSYDTIQQRKLFDLVEQLFQQDEYLVQQLKRTQIKSNSATTRHQYLVHGAGLGSFPQFAKQAATMAQSLRNAILSDVVNYDYEDTSALLQLLRQHIFHNVVRDGERSYLQREGIAQGSILSALLCSLYYGHLEATHLAALPLHGTDSARGEGLLLRFIDDFLYLTPHRECAVEFTRRMYQGYTDYGCTVNRRKTLVNFELAIDGFLVPQLPTRADGRRLMPWCGWLIDTRQLEIEGDYSRYQANYIGDALTIDYTNTPGQKLKDKAVKYCQQKMHLLLLDANLNSDATVYVNIYNAFMLCAIKMVRHTLSLRSMTAHNTDFILELFLGIIDYMFVMIKGKAASALGREMNCRCEIDSNVVRWLGLKSFIRVLKKKQTQFRVVIKALTLQLRSLRIDRRKLATLEAAIASESCVCFDYILY